MEMLISELVTRVTFTPDLSILSVIEGSYVQFDGKTSPGVPAPTVRWFKAENKSGIPPMEFTDGSQISIHPNISGTISSLQIIPRRNDSGIVIYCTAMNNFTEVESQRRVSLDVMCTCPIVITNNTRKEWPSF
ncbi:hypothetical protein DPMN_150379 [Dreissena polymorpha]|uniref:Ig-like domain-containing protein n=1 Tax=Dreissena polymorpha TaxID=45954 RepID=A0A9D4J698_DREPO|nr:hypothetical protein DPMN_150379 [Dreissena polymorpha]